jgi:NADH-quinone oxidoreductase subunit F
MKQHSKILLRNFERSDLHTLKGYQECGGFNGIRKSLNMSPDDVIEEVKQSGLRGRGGAGFPTGMKWGFVPKGTGKPIYLLANADESEPGTFKDRLLMERNPFALIEGLMIGSWALEVQWAAIYIRGEYAYPYIRLQEAVKECYNNGLLGKNILGANFSLDIVVHRGAGAYICGEETGLINSLEGRKGQPRLKPPFPAVVGLYGAPTVVNNVETLMALPFIITDGAASYRSAGTEKSPGTKLFSACGHVNKPGVYEVDLGYPILDFLNNECGGVSGTGRLKAIVPGGASVPALRADELEGVQLDYESLREAGTMLGSGGFIVMDDSTDMVEAALNFAHFYSHESCGQCTPCREGGHWIEKILRRILCGNGMPGDCELIKDVCSQIAGHTICPFGDALVTPILSYMKKFPDEFQKRLKWVGGV